MRGVITAATNTQTTPNIIPAVRQLLNLEISAAEVRSSINFLSMIVDGANLMTTNANTATNENIGQTPPVSRGPTHCAK
jgi:hypothetical protein